MLFFGIYSLDFGLSTPLRTSLLKQPLFFFFVYINISLYVRLKHLRYFRNSVTMTVCPLKQLFSNSLQR